MILVDTHVVVWITGDEKRLSSAAELAIREARSVAGGVAIAGSTLWELAMLATRSRIRLPGSLAAYLRHVEDTFVVLPISSKVAEQAMHFTSAYPTDPTDRIIGATALVHGIPLVTKDDCIRASKEVECIW